MQARALGLFCCAVTAAALPALAAGGPRTVSPGTTIGVDVISGSCPTFSWEAGSDAVDLDLVVYRLSDGAATPDAATAEPVIERRLPGGATAWTPPLAQCLEPGESYAWSIRAPAIGETGEWAPPGFFRVSERPAIEEVEAALDVLKRYLDGDASEQETATVVVAPLPSAAGLAVAPPPTDKEAGVVPDFKVSGIAEADVIRLGDTGGNFVFWDMQEEVNNDMTIKYGGELVRVTLGGNVGIGTGESVDQKLHVAGTAQVDKLRFEDTAGNSIHWDVAEDNVNDLIFTYVTPRVNFRSNGNVGIGTVGVPAQKLEVNGIVRLNLDTAAEAHVCIDAAGDLSDCVDTPMEGLKLRVERLEALLCRQGASADLCVGR